MFTHHGRGQSWSRTRSFDTILNRGPVSEWSVRPVARIRAGLQNSTTTMNKMVGAHHLKEKKKLVHGDIPTKVRKTPLVRRKAAIAAARAIFKRRRGASAAERCGKIDVLSVVRKSRNSSGGLYQCRRHSAHNRRRTNAMRFLMKTFVVRPAPRLIHALRPLWMRSGSRCCLLVLYQTPLGPSRGYWRGTITALDLLAPVQSCFWKAAARPTS